MVRTVVLSCQRFGVHKICSMSSLQGRIVIWLINWLLLRVYYCGRDRTNNLYVLWGSPFIEPPGASSAVDPSNASRIGDLGGKSMIPRGNRLITLGWYSRQFSPRIGDLTRPIDDYEGWLGSLRKPLVPLPWKPFGIRHKANRILVHIDGENRCIVLYHQLWSSTRTQICRSKQMQWINNLSWKIRRPSCARSVIKKITRHYISRTRLIFKGSLPPTHKRQLTPVGLNLNNACSTNLAMWYHDFGTSSHIAYTKF